MAWLAKSLADSLKLHDDGDVDDSDTHTGDEYPDADPSNQVGDGRSHPSDSSPLLSSEMASRGVKGDLSVFTETLTRQFWGVASFLAPPPPSSPRISSTADSVDPDASNLPGIDGIRSDFAEIGGKFRTGISKLSSNKTVSEITKIASNLLQLGSEEQVSVEGYSALGVVGVTEELVSFVSSISMHPGTWLDFPLPDNENLDVFDMSNVQLEHALAVERLAPILADLRLELCPRYMTEDRFWLIYFMLAHPKLNVHDAELLSTPQVVKAREMLQQALHAKSITHPKLQSPTHASHSEGTTGSANEALLPVPSTSQSESVPPVSSELESAPSPVAADLATEYHSMPTHIESQTIDRPVTEEVTATETSCQRDLDEKYEDDGDAWLEEDGDAPVGSNGTSVPIENEEDVSFSDLEDVDDEDGDVHDNKGKATDGSDSSTKDSRDWVQLSSGSAHPAASSKMKTSRSEAANKSNDWLDVEDLNME